MKNEISIASLIAGRYFFSKKSTHAVNIIAIVAVIGIAIVTAAMVCILSIFNGFEDFITSQISTISPEYRIVHKDGKVFSAKECVGLPSFQEAVGEHHTLAFESQAIANYANNHTIVNLLGVDSTYFSLLPIASLVVDGETGVGDETLPTAMSELGVAARLSAGIGYMEPMELVVAKREGRISMTMPHRSFNKVSVPITGIIQTDQPEHENLVVVPLSLVQRLQLYPSDAVTAIFMGKIQDKTKVKQLQEALPKHLTLQDKYQQYPDIYKVLKVEKWISFALLIFVLFLSLFSVISTLGMLIIEKKEDSKVLNILGARQSMLDKIILFEGWLLSITGLIIGLVVGLGVTYLQQIFGFIKLESISSGVFILDAYPVKVIWTDILSIVMVILLIGWTSSVLAHKIFGKRTMIS